MRIDVYRPNGLGDTLLIAPALRALRASYDAHIALWGHPSATYLLMYLGLCDEANDHRKGLRLPERPDVFVGWDWDEWGLVTASEGFEIPRFRVGSFIAPRGVHQARHCFNTMRDVLPDMDEDTYTERPFRLRTGQFNAEVDAEWSGAILIHLATTMKEKRWPLDRYVMLACRLRDRGYPVAFLESPSDVYAESEIPILTRGLLGQAWLLQHAALYIGNDTGPTHLAGMMGCPTIALFGGSNPVIWRPIGEQVTVLQTCERQRATDEHFWCRNHDCFKDLSVDMVEAEALSILERNRLRAAE